MGFQTFPHWTERLLGLGKEKENDREADCASAILRKQWQKASANGNYPMTVHSAGNLFGLDPALYLRSVSVLTIAFGGLTCHRWLCMLLNIRCTVLSNPTLSAILLLSLQSPDRGHKSTPDDLQITRG